MFGSNLAGRHGKGAALHARVRYGAEYGVGEGRTGDAYAIPTKDAKLRTLPVSTVRIHVGRFIEYATENSDLFFRVTRVGCGHAGHTDSSIAPLFRDAPMNCMLPEYWSRYY